MPITLEVAPRTSVGRSAHRLRHEGLVPGVIYGHAVAPLNVQVAQKELTRVAHTAGRSHLLSLKVKGERRLRPVLIRELQREPRSASLLHVDFFQVNLTEKLNVAVPVVLTGESPAVKFSLGELLQVIHSLEVNCLPDSIPGEFSVDVSALAEVDDAVRIGALELPEGVELSGSVDPEEVVVKIAPSRVAAAEEEVPAPEAVAPEGPEEATASEGPA